MDESHDDPELTAQLDRILLRSKVGAVVFLVALLGLGIVLLLRKPSGGDRAPDLLLGSILVVTTLIGLASLPRVLRISDERRANALTTLAQRRDGTWRSDVSNPGGKAKFNLVAAVASSVFAVLTLVEQVRDGFTVAGGVFLALWAALAAGNLWGARNFSRIRRERLAEDPD